MKIYSETFGCTMNRADTELMLGELSDSGHEIVEELGESDLVIVNTCAVKRPTLNRVIYRLRELYEETDKKLIVAGCLPLIDLEKVEEIGEFEAIISCLTTESIGEVVERISRGEGNIRYISGESRKLSRPKFKMSDVSAPVPIAEGCVANCSYCCVKFARGDLRSFDPSNIVEEIREEVSSGRREIYLTTQDTAAYGLDSGTDLPSLLDMITSIPGDFRVRVGMMSPAQAKGIKKELAESFDSEKIYKFLHLPVQSGNDGVLKDMRRNYTVEDFREIVRTFRESFSNLYLATDIIVGFPGVDEEAFRDSCDLMEEIEPDKMNITRFTPMPGTDAKEMDQVRSEEKKRRSREMTSIHHRISHEKNREYVGEELECLVIKKGKKGGYEARLPNYKPVIVEEAEPGEFVRIRVLGAEETYLTGEVVGVGN